VVESSSRTGPDPAVWRLLFSFTKEGSAVFHGHLSLIEIFSMALTRAGVDVLYTQGFNPLAKMEIVAPLSVGISAGAEIAAVDFGYALDAGEFTEKMNAALVEGIRVNRAECFHIPSGAKKHSLSSLLWGFGYGAVSSEQGAVSSEEGWRERCGGETVYVPAKEEKALRERLLGTGETVFSLRRVCVLAKNIVNGNSEQPWESYFDVYRRLYQYP
jgi:radical SAM-linked protein